MTQLIKEKRRGRILKWLLIFDWNQITRTALRHYGKSLRSIV
jgi:hypothetical protein